MIADDHELNATLERIRHLQDQVAYLRQVETNPANYHLSAWVFLAEIDHYIYEREVLPGAGSEQQRTLLVARGLRFLPRDGTICTPAACKFPWLCEGWFIS
jgi:hypothetical protein